MRIFFGEGVQIFLGGAGKLFGGQGCKSFFLEGEGVHPSMQLFFIIHMHCNDREPCYLKNQSRGKGEHGPRHSISFIFHP
jgi:hypothetical protein